MMTHRNYVHRHEMTAFRQEVNYNIAGSLSNRPVRSQFQVRISEDMADFLREQLGLNGRFQLMPEICEILGLLSRITLNNYCVPYHYRITALRVRVWRRRESRFVVNNVHMAIPGPRFISFRITRENEVNFD